MSGTTDASARARQAALDMLRPYAHRGDTEEYTRSGHMGHYGRDYHCQIGGYPYPPTKVLVSQISGIDCHEALSLHELWVELRAELQPRTVQASLFGEVT